jgi:hypothetical protein
MNERIISFKSACSEYENRYTMEHVPAWAKIKCENGKFYAPQFASDKEWYDSTLFPGESFVGEKEVHCFTQNQTWPIGNWLDRVYSEKGN